MTAIQSPFSLITYRKMLQNSHFYRFSILFLCYCKITVLLHLQNSLAKTRMHRYNNLAYEIALSLYRFGADESSTKESKGTSWSGGMTEVTAEPLSEAADGRERGAEKYAGSLYNYKTKRRDEKKKGGMIAMKKFLSMVMAAAMVVSLVPATAFAASGDVKARASVVEAESYADGDLNDGAEIGNDAELMLRFTTASYSSATASAEIEVTLENATWDADKILSQAGVSGAAPNVFYINTDKKDATAANYRNGASGKFVAVDDNTEVLTDSDNESILVSDVELNADEDVLTFTLSGKMTAGWELLISLDSLIDNANRGKTATVTVESDDIEINNGDDLVYASIEREGIDVSVKDTVDVAEDEITTLEDITIEATVGDFHDFGLSAVDPEDELTLRLNNGFEFVTSNMAEAELTAGATTRTLNGWGAQVDDDEIVIPMDDAMIADGIDEWEITGLKIDSADAKAGSVATLRVTLDGSDTVSVEVATVVEYAVQMSVDEDEDVPVIYSGVNVDNDGITDDSDHESLEVTIEETFAGAWNNSKDFTLSVPEGVYIVDVVSPTFDIGTGGVDNGEYAWFEAAYNEGDYVNLTFEKRSWDESDPDDPDNDDPIELTFQLVLVADPNFEGDVVLTLSGDAMEEQEVTIAKFVKTFTVTAEQNDMKIDYRNTEIPTSVVITEAEAGLWDKDTEFVLELDKINFDDEGTITVDDKSGLEIKDDEVKLDGRNRDNDVLYFTVDSRSDDEPAEVTISGMQLYMDRSLPAGAYDLDVYSTSMLNGKNFGISTGYLGEEVLGMRLSGGDVDCIADINDDFVSYTAKAGFVNIVTAGREDDDSSFTTKVVVPVGENYLIAGENQIALDVPAYISADGYTMLPIRAVAYALGINTNSVLWDQPSRTVTIMYGSRIISMQNGQSVMYVSGQAIPMSAAVEIVDGRAFIPMRDLGVALGVSDIAWDAATRTATLNGSK